MRRGDRFLIMHTVPAGHWSHPAGQVETDETPRDAAQRELREETGLEAPVVDLGIPQHYRVPVDARHRYPEGLEEVRVESFSADAPEGWEPMISAEHDDVRWSSYDEAMQLLTWPEARSALAAAVQGPGT